MERNDGSHTVIGCYGTDISFFLWSVSPGPFVFPHVFPIDGQAVVPECTFEMSAVLIILVSIDCRIRYQGFSESGKIKASSVNVGVEILDGSPAGGHQADRLLVPAGS